MKESKKSLISLTRKIISFNTVNPPGNERPCANYLGGILEGAGFRVKTYEFAEKRTSLVASLKGREERPPLCFSGHLDTVPLGRASWRMDPFVGETEGDKIYGRGASDMKGGIAAMVMMALRVAELPNLKAGLTLVLTAGEETGCEGARYLAETAGALERAGALVIGEPTSNVPLIGHKGAVRFELITRGRTAHASMPEEGDNAIYRAARALAKLESFDFKVPEHLVLGKPTLNVGTISGGIAINSVPDYVSMGVDIRPIPGMDAGGIEEQLRSTLGQDVEIRCLEEIPGVVSDVDNPWIREVFDIVVPYHSAPPVLRGAPYFTDGSFFASPMGHPPLVLLGPGEAEQAHSTDEFCYLTKIKEAVEIYFEISRRWCLNT